MIVCAPLTLQQGSLAKEMKCKPMDTLEVRPRARGGTRRPGPPLSAALTWAAWASSGDLAELNVRLRLRRRQSLGPLLANRPGRPDLRPEAVGRGPDAEKREEQEKASEDKRKRGGERRG